MTESNLRSLIENFKEYSSEDAVIAFDKDKKRSMSYKELRNLIQRLSAGLAESGLEKGNTVLLMAPSSTEFIIAVLAVINAGAVAVPIDFQSNDEVLKHIVKDSAAKFIFTDARGFEKLHRLKLDKKLSVHRLDDPDESNYWKNLSSSKKMEDPQLGPDDPAVIFYTSGTTGMPKGVPLSHMNLCSQITAVKNLKLLHRKDRMLLPLPLFHVYPFVVGMLSPLSLGLGIVLPKSVTGPEIVKALKEGQVTVLMAVPRLMRALYSAIESKYRAHKLSSAIFDAARAVSNATYLACRLHVGKTLFKPVHKQFPNLRLVCCGGALLDPKLAENFRALGWQVAIGYGLTETSPLLTIRMPDNLDLESVGKPVPGVEIRLAEIKEEDEETID
jgi:long-chain acyl-CoA synthetase